MWLRDVRRIEHDVIERYNEGESSRHRRAYDPPGELRVHLEIECTYEELQALLERVGDRVNVDQAKVPALPPPALPALPMVHEGVEVE